MRTKKKRFLKYVPGFIKGKVIREKINIPDAPLLDFTFKIATELEELEQAFRLIYRAYRLKGFIHPKTSGMHLMQQHAHPLSTTFVGKLKDRVVITMSVFTDSEMGLPMDTLYKNELDRLRNKGRFIAEVGNFASEPAVRKGNQLLPMMMNNLMSRYAKKHLRLDDLVITVNPAHEFIYKHIILFKRIGEVRSYDTVNGHLAVPMLLDLNEYQRTYFKKYHGKARHKDLHRFFFITDFKNLRLPKENQILSVFDKNIYTHFFVKMAASNAIFKRDEQQFVFKLYEKYNEILEPKVFENVRPILVPSKKTVWT